MKQPTCEHGIHYGPRCRKRARVAVQYLSPFGTRVDMVKGDVPVFIRKITLRCNAHRSKKDFRGLTLQGIVTVAEYLRKQKEYDEAVDQKEVTR